VALARKHTERGHEAYALRLLGELCADDPIGVVQSEELYAQAIALADRLEMRPLLAQCQLGLARRLLRVGEQASAESRLNAARAMFETLEMPFWLEQAQALPARP
jgi:hypothetical protein